MLEAMEQAMQHAQEATPGQRTTRSLAAALDNWLCCAADRAPLLPGKELHPFQPTSAQDFSLTLRSLPAKRRLPPCTRLKGQQPAGVAEELRPAAAHPSSQGPAGPGGGCCRQQAPAQAAGGAEGGGAGAGSTGGRGDGDELFHAGAWRRRSMGLSAAPSSLGVSDTYSSWSLPGFRTHVVAHAHDSVSAARDAPCRPTSTLADFMAGCLCTCSLRRRRRIWIWPPRTHSCSSASQSWRPSQRQQRWPHRPNSSRGNQSPPSRPPRSTSACPCWACAARTPACRSGPPAC